MSMKSKPRWVRRTLIVTGGTAFVGLLSAGSLSAQSLDMDPLTAPAPTAPAAVQAGGLDMGATPTPPKANTAPVQPSPTLTVQDGVAPLNTRFGLDASATDAPATSAPVSANTSPAPSEPPMILDAPGVVAAAPPPVVLDHPRVINTATLQGAGTTVSLFGIEGITGDAAQNLQNYLSASGGPLTCQAHASAGFVCKMVDGTDVAQVALLNGAARTSSDATDAYRKQEADAQNARRGIWVDLPPPPETITHPVVPDTATLAVPGKAYMLDGIVGFQAPYSGQLQGYIATSGDAATCSPQGTPGRFVCLLPDGTDVAKVALVNGAARVDTDAPDSYRVQQLDALNNRRGYWATASNADISAALIMPPAPTDYVLVPGDDGVDGITYVGGAPVIEVDGQPAFLIYGDDELGWGYYDHYHHWHGAPGRYRDHMEHFHPGGRGLRGYGGERYGAHYGDRRREDGARCCHDGMRREDMARHEDGMRRDQGFRRDEGMRREMGGPREQQFVRREEGPNRAEAAHGFERPGATPGRAMTQAARPGMGAPGGHPGGIQQAAARGPVGGGFGRPSSPAGGGFHPAAAAPHPAAAPRAAAPAGRHK